ncbi:glutathione-dependent formaldehyde-activating enzyme [Ophiostoma piceae UAMH 11346]|uniref:Glutathione-dependent formaldehyde-activating enzyme n=1 Tax=Ophiostoma piceae (strain UAMH 11346) TaxID=1262450 RepID=S3CD80_OPHP1|nr:glutathione-dependent formaldehyde-activating enzyme [Ophiostoma piceae UAMH 11346]
MPETTYRANCHCGKFVYEATLPEPLTEVYACNCSVCTKKSYLFAFEPKSGINIVKGSLDELKSYTFGDKYVHKFCGDCGSPVLVISNEPGRGKALNTRCFQNVDVWSLKKIPFDGASLPSPYKEPEFTGNEPTGEPIGGGKPTIYHGGCHCGAVRLSVRCQPLDDSLSPAKEGDRIVECNCSICNRNGYRWFYPKVDQVTVQDPGSSMVKYVFGKHVSSKSFCGKCGVPLITGSVHLSEDELAKLPDYCRTDAANAWRAHVHGMCPINTRVLHGVDLDKLPIKFHQGDTLMQPLYVNP